MKSVQNLLAVKVPLASFVEKVGIFYIELSTELTKNNYN